MPSSFKHVHRRLSQKGNKTPLRQGWRISEGVKLAIRLLAQTDSHGTGRSSWRKKPPTHWIRKLLELLVEWNCFKMFLRGVGVRRIIRNVVYRDESFGIRGVHRWDQRAANFQAILIWYYAWSFWHTGYGRCSNIGKIRSDQTFPSREQVWGPTKNEGSGQKLAGMIYHSIIHSRSRLTCLEGLDPPARLTQPSLRHPST